MTARDGAPAIAKHTEASLRRRFTLLDGMIAVAAVAAELGLVRAFDLGYDPEFHDELWTRPRWFFNSWMIDQFIYQLFELATTAALCATLATLAYRLRRPRPAWRRLAGQPGTQAVLAALAAWALVLPTYAQRWSMEDEPYTYHVFFGLNLDNVPVFAAFGVATWWGTICLSGRWRSEPTWVDRLGRLVGVVWMALGLWAVHLRTIC